MKKTVLSILLFICVFAGVFAFNSTFKANAEGNVDNVLSTSPFLPASYLEYYNLSSPTDVAEDKNHVYIAENKAVLKFDKTTQEYSKLSLDDMMITKIACFNDKVYFLSSSKLFLISDDFTTYKEVANSISTYFYMSDLLYSNTSSDIKLFALSGENFVEQESYSLGTTTLFCVDEGNETEVFHAIYYFTESSCYALYRQTGARVKLFDASVSYATFYDKKIYYATGDGIFTYSTTNGLITQLTYDTSSQPSGFSLYGDRMFISYRNINLVKEFDLRSYSFTGKIITTFSDLAGRLPEQVTEITSDGEHLFVLKRDSSLINRLMKFSSDGKTCLEVNVDLSFNPDIICVSGEYVALANGSDTIKIVKLGEAENGLIATEETLSVRGTDASNVVAIVNFEEDFFIIKNATVTGSKQFPTVITASKTSAGYSFDVNEFYYYEEKEGTAKTATVNAFGEIFIAMTDGSVIEYDAVNNSARLKDCTLPSSASKIQADFENLYFLSEGKITNADSGETYVISKNKNYGEKEAVSFEFMLLDNKAYFLYGGFILYTTSLPLKTPNTFLIPENYDTTLKEQVDLACLNENAKMYEVQKGEKYFEYVKYKINTSSLSFVVINDSYNDFLLIADDEKTYIVRKADVDVTSAEQVSPSLQKGYYLSSAGVYAIPKLNATFKIATASKHEKVKVLSQVSVNGKSYLLIEREGGQTGYIEQSFIAKEIAELTEKERCKIYKVKNCTVFDEDGNEIGEINNGVVAVYSFKNGRYKIAYADGEDGYGYIPYSAIITEKDNVIRNTILLIIVITSFLITAIYLQVRARRKKLNL